MLFIHLIQIRTLSLSVKPVTHIFANNTLIGALTTLKLLSDLRTITAIKLHVMLNVIPHAQPKQNRPCLFFHPEAITMDHFKVGV